jgi:hypothetical protein
MTAMDSAHAVELDVNCLSTCVVTVRSEITLALGLDVDDAGQHRVDVREVSGR